MSWFDFLLIQIEILFVGLALAEEIRKLKKS